MSFWKKLGREDIWDVEKGTELKIVGEELIIYGVLYSVGSRSSNKACFAFNDSEEASHLFTEAHWNVKEVYIANEE